jgi:hypothetical protein
LSKDQANEYSLVKPASYSARGEYLQLKYAISIHSNAKVCTQKGGFSVKATDRPEKAASHDPALGFFLGGYDNVWKPKRNERCRDHSFMADSFNLGGLCSVKIFGQYLDFNPRIDLFAM